MGADAVLVNSAISSAQDPVKMANAIALAIKQQVFKGDANNEYR